MSKTERTKNIEVEKESISEEAIKAAAIDVGTQDNILETIVYVGPTIIGVASQNTIYNGLSSELKQAINNEPAFKNLLVSLSELSKALESIDCQKGAIYEFYKKVLDYKI